MTLSHGGSIKQACANPTWHMGAAPSPHHPNQPRDMTADVMRGASTLDAHMTRVSVPDTAVPLVLHIALIALIALCPHAKLGWGFWPAASNFPFECQMQKVGSVVDDLVRKGTSWCAQKPSVPFFARLLMNNNWIYEPGELLGLWPPNPDGRVQTTVSPARLASVTSK